MFKRKKDRGANHGDEVVILSDGTQLGQRAAEESVNIAKPRVLLPFLRTAVGATVVFGIVGAILYAALGVSLLGAIPTKDAGATWVTRTSLPGGQAQAGQYVFASRAATPPGDSVLAKAQQLISGVDMGGVYFVLGGPNGEIRNGGGMSISFDKEYNGTYGKLPRSPYLLVEQYALMCVAGDCETNKVYFLPSENVVGEAKYRSDNPLSFVSYTGAYEAATEKYWKDR